MLPEQALCGGTPAERAQAALAVLGDEVGERARAPRRGTADTARTGASLPRARSAVSRSRTARPAGAPTSAFVTTSRSGTSMIPALRNWRTSPAPGWTTTATLSAASATSVSDCPTPTVSITTTSKATASAWAAARVAAARPPSRPPAAIERTNRPRSPGSASIRARSPSSAPPERRDEGSTASTATVRPRARQTRASAPRSVDFPAPGGPVTPITWAGASPPSAAGPTAAASAAAAARPAGELFSTALQTAGAAARSRARSRSVSVRS